MGEEDLAVNVIKEGYLGKKIKHNIIKKVQQRYFKLLDYELLYWKKKEQADSGEEPLAYIPLKVTFGVRQLAEDKSNQATLSLLCCRPTRTHM